MWAAAASLERPATHRPRHTGASLTQQFGENGAIAVAQYGESQRRPTNDAREADALRGQVDRSATQGARFTQLEAQGYTVEGSRTTLADPALREQYERWGEGGSARVAAHVVVGGLTGGASGFGAAQGAVGAGVSAAAVPEVARAVDQLGLSDGVRTAVITAAGTALGAVAGPAGAMTALNQTTNNFLRHQDADAMRREMTQCRAQPNGCSDAETTSIVDRYREVSTRNIAAVDACVFAGNVSCVQQLTGQAASPSEVSAILPFGYGLEERQFVERQNNVVQYGSVRGAYSMFGSDAQQAAEIARFRQESCGGLSATACDTLTRQALDDRLARVGVLAIAGAAPVALNTARGLRPPTRGRSAAEAATVEPRASAEPEVTSPPNVPRMAQTEPTTAQAARLVAEHSGQNTTPLTQTTAERILNDYRPPGGSTQVAGEGVQGADVRLFDTQGRAVAGVEIKAVEGYRGFQQNVSRATLSSDGGYLQLPEGGTLAIQVPDGTDVSRYLARYWGVSGRTTDPADLARLSNTYVVIYDQQGRVILPRQPIYKPPKQP